MYKFITCLILILLNNTYAQEKVDYQKYLPTTTSVVISMNNLSQVKIDLKKHPIYKFWEDKSVQAFLEKPLAKISQTLEQLKQERGIALLDYLNSVTLAQGQVVLALTDLEMGSSGPEFSAVLAMDFGSNKAKVNELLEKIWLASEKYGLIKEEEKLLSEKIIRIKPNQEKFEEMGFNATSLLKMNPGYCFVGNTLVFGLGKGITQFVSAMKNTDKKSASLLDHPNYNKAMAKCQLEGQDTHIFINFEPLMQFARDIAGEQKGQMFNEVVEILGLTNMKSLASTGRAFSLGETANTKGFIYIPGKRKGLLAAFAEVADFTPLTAPMDAGSYNAMGIQPKTLWQIAISIIKVLNPGMLQELDAFEQRAGFSIGNDLIPTLGNVMRTYEYYEMPMTATFEKTLVSLSLANEASFRNYAEKWLSLNMQMMQKLEFKGATIYSMPEQPDLPKGFPTPAFAIHDKQFLFSTHRSCVENAITNKGDKNLASFSPFKKIYSRIAGKNVAVSYSNFTPLITALIDLVQQFSQQLERDESFSSWIDLKKLPPQEVLEKNLSFVDAFKMSLDQEGFYFEQYIHFDGK